MKYILPFVACLPFVLVILQYFRCSNALTRKTTTVNATLFFMGTVLIQILLCLFHKSAILLAIVCLLCLGLLLLVYFQKDQKNDGRAITKAGMRISEKSGKAVVTAATTVAGVVVGGYTASAPGAIVGGAAGAVIGNATGEATGEVLGSIADKIDENDGEKSIDISDQAFDKLNNLSDSIAESGAQVIDGAANSNGIPLNISSAISDTELTKDNQIEDTECIKSRNDFIEACKKLGIDATDSTIDDVVRSILMSAPNLAKTKLESMPDMNDYDKAVYILERRYLQ